MIEFIDNSELSVRAVNSLTYLGIKTVEDLKKWSARDLRKQRNFGKKTLFEIRCFLAKRNLTLREEVLITEQDIKDKIKEIPSTLKEMVVQVRDMRSILLNLEDYLERALMPYDEKT